MRKFEKADIAIRSVRQGDFAEMFELRKELFHEELVAAGVPTKTAYHHTEKWSLEKAAVAWGAWLDNPDYYLRVVTQGGTISGTFTGLYTLSDAEVPELLPHVVGRYAASIQLHPAVRRKGVGRALMEKFTAEGHGPTYLHVLEGNKQARGFYERLGFRAIALTGSTIGGSYPVKKLLMRGD